MTSPSISRTKRNTPCAAGCCGPKFIVKFRISAIRRPVGFRIGEGRVITIVMANNLRHEGPGLDGHRLVDHPALLRVVAHLDIARQRKILAEGMPDEAVVGE